MTYIYIYMCSLESLFCAILSPCSEGDPHSPVVGDQQEAADMTAVRHIRHVCRVTQRACSADPSLEKPPTSASH